MVVGFEDVDVSVDYVELWASQTALDLRTCTYLHIHMDKCTMLSDQELIMMNGNYCHKPKTLM